VLDGSPAIDIELCARVLLDPTRRCCAQRLGASDALRLDLERCRVNARFATGRYAQDAAVTRLREIRRVTTAKSSALVPKCEMHLANHSSDV
jgi:hypothetical protein